MKKREEIEEKYKWDLSSYFKTETEFKKELEKVKTDAKEITKFVGKLNNEKSIINCLNLKYALDERFEVLYVYASLKTREDAENSKDRENMNFVESAYVEYNSSSSFIESEIKDVSDKVLKYLQEKYDYKNYFKEIIRQKQHILSKEEEKLLAGTGEFAGGFSDNFDMFDDGDLKFGKVKNSKGEDVELNHSNFIKLMESEDRELRKNTMKRFNGAYGDFNNFLSANYINNVKKNVFYAKTRKFNSVLEKSIFNEEASQEVYDTLISGVNQNLNVFHKYFEIKRKTLGYDKLGMYDLYTKVKGIDNKYTFNEAMQNVKNATKQLGAEYQKLLDRAVNERWIDILPNKGKDSGAFSWGAFGKNPVVLLNFVNDTNSNFTLAHELGHCMHTYYSNKNQPFDRAGYTIFVAEVASNVNELLLLEYLKNNAKTKEEKIYYLDYFVSQFRGSVFRQTMFAEFEEFAHKTYESGNAISKDVLNDFYFKLNKTYFGKNVELIDEIKYEWSRIPHFFNSFYVYKYATGLICALVLSRKILFENGKDAYLNFLSSGSKKTPVELLKEAGVDLTKKETFAYAFKAVEDALNEWESLL